MVEEASVESGRLPVSDGNELYVERAGNPEGAAVLWLHGGPGSGAGVAHRERIDPVRQQAISFDQRGCGRSTPLATQRLDALDSNTTAQLIEDIEAVRMHFDVDRWMLTGASWGATLALAYAQAHPERVSTIALMAVTNTSRAEVEWVTEAMGRVFPEEWDRFAAAVARSPGERIVDAYARALRDPNPAVRAAAAQAWGRWEDVHVSLGPDWAPDSRWQDPPVRDVLATLVTHYWSHSGFGGDDIIGRMERLADIAGVLIHGRRDISGPAITAYRLHQAWRGSKLIITDEGHGGPESSAALRRAIRELGG